MARIVEASEFGKFAVRVLRAYSRRVGVQADIGALTDLVALRAQVDEAITVAVRQLHAAGYSWTEIATELGVTRQAARQRYLAVTA